MSPATALVIDEVGERGRSLAQQLSAAGLKVLQADSPRAGYAILKLFRVELVLINLQVSDLEALEALIYLVGQDTQTIYHSSEAIWPFRLSFPEKRPVIVSTRTLQQLLAKIASPVQLGQGQPAGKNEFLRPLFKEMKDASSKHPVL